MPTRTTIVLDDKEYRAEYFFHPFCPGSVQDGQKMEPDEPPFVELVRVWDPDSDYEPQLDDDTTQTIEQDLLDEELDRKDDF